MSWLDLGTERSCHSGRWLAPPRKPPSPRPCARDTGPGRQRVPGRTRAQPDARGPPLTPAPRPGSPAAEPHEARVHAPPGRPGPGVTGHRREVPDGARPMPAAQRGKSMPRVPDTRPSRASNFCRLPSPSGPPGPTWKERARLGCGPRPQPVRLRPGPRLRSGTGTPPLGVSARKEDGGGGHVAVPTGPDTGAEPSRCGAESLWVPPAVGCLSLTTRPSRSPRVCSSPSSPA